MKKELAAAAIVVVLLAGALYNITYLQRFIGSVTQNIELSRQLLESGDSENALGALNSAVSKWMHADGYTHIFIRHSEIDATTDAFFDLVSCVTADDTAQAAGAYEKLTAHLNSILTMEYVTLGSIF